MQVLDKCRDFGEVWGAEDGSKYVQDGIYFDGSGYPVGGQPVKAPPKKQAFAEAKPMAINTVDLESIDEQVAKSLA